MKNRNILVVEDSIDMRELIQIALEESDYAVSVAASGSEAFSLLEQNKFDAILLDMNLSDMNGATFMHRLKSDVRFESLKVIVVSGEDNLRTKSQEIKANGFIKKPFDLDAFYSSIEKILTVS